MEEDSAPNRILTALAVLRQLMEPISEFHLETQRESIDIRQDAQHFTVTVNGLDRNDS